MEKSVSKSYDDNIRKLIDIFENIKQKTMKNYI